MELALWQNYTLFSHGVYEDLHVCWGFDVRLDEVIVCIKKAKSGEVNVFGD